MLGEHFRIEVEDLRLVVGLLLLSVLVDRVRAVVVRRMRGCVRHGTHAKRIRGVRHGCFPNAQDDGTLAC